MISSITGIIFGIGIGDGEYRKTGIANNDAEFGFVIKILLRI